jgi:hypothetical protein
MLFPIKVDVGGSRYSVRRVRRPRKAGYSLWNFASICYITRDLIASGLGGAMFIPGGSRFQNFIDHCTGLSLSSIYEQLRNSLHLCCSCFCTRVLAITIHMAAVLMSP